MRIFWPDKYVLKDLSTHLVVGLAVPILAINSPPHLSVCGVPCKTCHFVLKKLKPTWWQSGCSAWWWTPWSDTPPRQPGQQSGQTRRRNPRPRGPCASRGNFQRSLRRWSSTTSPLKGSSVNSSLVRQGCSCDSSHFDVPGNDQVDNKWLSKKMNIRSWYGAKSDRPVMACAAKISV